MDKFQNRYRIPSARAGWHNYDDGIYFVTICTAGMQHYFGEIYKCEMHLTEIGEIAQQHIKHVQTHYPYARIPIFVVMPNHIHAIVCIDGDTAECAGGVETVCTPSLSSERWKNDVVNRKMQEISKRKGRLSIVIGGIKSATTRYAHTHAIPFAWQTRFHDHIIRNSNELNRIADYIENNVIKWDDDKFNI